MARILVTDGEERSALAVVRSLGRAGHTVGVGARHERSLAGASRYTRFKAVLPDPLADPGAFAMQVSVAASRQRCEMVVPVTDASALAILARPPEGAVVPLPSLATFSAISDKAAVAEVAAELGIGVPRQVRAERRDDAQAFEAARLLTMPLVLKPARSVATHGTGLAKQGVIHVADWAAAERAIAELADAAFPLLIQERIVGPGVGVFALVHDGRTVACFAHRRIREKPPSGGVSVLCESVPLDPGLLERTIALLSRFAWNGVAMVEYKFDSAAARPVLMEINGRFWGSLQLAIDSGVDFPCLLVEAALGRAVQPVSAWRIGVRSRWWWGDVDHLLARIRRSSRALSLPPDAPGRLAAIGAFAAAALLPSRDQVLRLSDPAPFVLESAQWLRTTLHL